MKEEAMWSDRKRILGMPISFTKYELKNKRIYTSRGLFSTSEHEVLLYRILDFSLERTLLDRILGVGTVTLYTCDQSDKELKLEKIKNPKGVRDMLSDLVESERKKLNLKGREMYGFAGRMDDFQDDLDE